MMAIPKEIIAFYPFKITERENLSKMARNDKPVIWAIISIREGNLN